MPAALTAPSQLHAPPVIIRNICGLPDRGFLGSLRFPVRVVNPVPAAVSSEDPPRTPYNIYLIWGLPPDSSMPADEVPAQWRGIGVIIVDPVVVGAGCG